MYPRVILTHNLTISTIKGSLISTPAYKSSFFLKLKLVSVINFRENHGKICLNYIISFVFSQKTVFCFMFWCILTDELFQ